MEYCNIKLTDNNVCAICYVPSLTDSTDCTHCRPSRHAIGSVLTCGTRHETVSVLTYETRHETGSVLMGHVTRLVVY
jgi:hypothetical protein